MSASSADHLRRLGTAFASGGDRYDRLRPGYPPEAVDWLVAATPAGGRAADVGSGTGKLAAALADRGLDVVAVDPSADMLAQLRVRRPDVRLQVGTGERTGLADRSVELVTFAQSWHWVEPVAGSAEVARILAPGGSLAMVWNFLDVRVDWVAELAAAWHTLSDAESIDATRHVPELGPAFSDLATTTLDWSVPMSRDDLADLVTTRSYYLSASAVDQEAIRDRAAALLAGWFSATESIELPYRTHGYRARLLEA